MRQRTATHATSLARHAGKKMCSHPLMSDLDTSAMSALIELKGLSTTNRGTIMKCEKHTYETQPDGTEVCFECHHVRPMSNLLRQRAYKQRMRDAGLVQVTDWIPAGMKEQHKQFCDTLRDSGVAVVLSGEK